MRPVKRADPVYPEAARKAGITGWVRLLVTIDMRGAPVSMQVLDGHPLLRSAAIDAVNRWVYRPVVRNGAPVAATTIASLWFGPGPPGPEPPLRQPVLRSAVGEPGQL